MFLFCADGFLMLFGWFEFVSGLVAVQGVFLLLQYVLSLELVMDAVDGGLVLVSVVNHYLVNSMFVDSSRYAKVGELVVFVYLKDVVAVGVSDGVTVWVGNDCGLFVVVVLVIDVVW